MNTHVRVRGGRRAQARPLPGSRRRADASLFFGRHWPGAAALCVSRERMKRFCTIAGFWTVCFVLLFLFYFVADFYVIVGSGPGSWKKSTPLSFGERFILSLIGATVVSMVTGLIAALAYSLYRASRWLLRKANQ